MIGAGVAALACCEHLAPLGYSLTVFESGRLHGGRLGPSRAAGRSFSAGASFFSPVSPAFRQASERWVQAGLAVPCHLSVAVLPSGAAGAAAGWAWGGGLRRGGPATFMTSMSEPVAGFRDMVAANKAVCLMDRTGAYSPLPVSCSPRPLPLLPAPGQVRSFPLLVRSGSFPPYWSALAAPSPPSTYAPSRSLSLLHLRSLPLPLPHALTLPPAPSPSCTPAPSRSLLVRSGGFPLSVSLFRRPKVCTLHI